MDNEQRAHDLAVLITKFHLNKKDETDPMEKESIEYLAGKYVKAYDILKAYLGK